MNRISIKKQTSRSTQFLKNAATNINLIYSDSYGNSLFEIGLVTSKAWGDFENAESPVVQVSVDGADFNIPLPKFKQLINSLDNE